MVVFLAEAQEDGTLDFGSELNKYRLKETLKKYSGRTFRLSLPKERRTLSQNNYYWLYLGIIERETGNGSNDLHEYFKRKHLPPVFIKAMGNELKIPASTVDLSKTDFGEYLDKICAESGVPLPDPVEAGYITG